MDAVGRGGHVKRMGAIAAVMSWLLSPTASSQSEPQWPVHSMTRPKPRVVNPGPFVAPVPPPADAIVLFDGSSLAPWRAADAAKGPARWRVENGYFQVEPGRGTIETTREFGDVQMHIEWMTPTPARGSGQDRGNSGVFLMGHYELQVLDSYDNETYADGQAAALYGEFPPLVNASRPPGQWQSFDIVFRRPRFNARGNVTRPARMTVLHNGVLVHDARELTGPTAHQVRLPYAAHPDRLPISLQDHGNPVRFRNVWVRELSDEG
jgi:hypothetical protein